MSKNLQYLRWTTWFTFISSIHVHSPSFFNCFSFSFEQRNDRVLHNSLNFMTKLCYKFRNCQWKYNKKPFLKVYRVACIWKESDFEMFIVWFTFIYENLYIVRWNDPSSFFFFSLNVKTMEQKSSGEEHKENLLFLLYKNFVKRWKTAEKSHQRKCSSFNDEAGC